MGGWRAGARQASLRLESVFHKLVERTVRRDLSYRLLVQPDQETLNAYAETDGRVILTSGLVRALPTGDDLAFVMAHELAHLEARHAEILSNQNQVNHLSLRLNLSEPSELLATAAGVGSRLLTSGYSKSMESEADLAALGLLARAGYDPGRALLTLQLLQRLEDSLGRARVFGDHLPAGVRLSIVRGCLHQHGM